MNYECEIIQDLIPLVKDGIAGEKSGAAVALHITECAVCKEIYQADVKVVMPPLEESSEISQVTHYKKRIKKRRKIIIFSIAILAVILVIGTGLVTGPVIKLFAGESYTTRNIADYGNYSGHMEVEKEGIFTLLSIFPKEIPKSAEVKDYYYFCNNGGLFDNSYQIYLVCSYNQEDFEKEKDRLHSLEISFRGNIHKPIITDTGFDFPAVVTMFGHKESFEYTLFDDETRTVVYVYAQSMGIKKSVVPSEYRPKGFEPSEDLLTEWGAYSYYLFKYDDIAYITPGLDNVE